jgi:hypothetical protein
VRKDSGQLHPSLGLSASFSIQNVPGLRRGARYLIDGIVFIKLPHSFGFFGTRQRQSDVESNKPRALETLQRLLSGTEPGIVWLFAWLGRSTWKIGSARAQLLEDVERCSELWPTGCERSTERRRVIQRRLAHATNGEP